MYLQMNVYFNPQTHDRQAQKDVLAIWSRHIMNALTHLSYFISKGFHALTPAAYENVHGHSTPVMKQN